MWPGGRTMPRSAVRGRFRCRIDVGRWFVCVYTYMCSPAVILDSPP